MPMNTTATAPSANAIGMPENITTSVAIAVREADTENAHGRLAPAKGSASCTRIWTQSRLMPNAISE